MPDDAYALRLLPTVRRRHSGRANQRRRAHRERKPTCWPTTFLQDVTSQSPITAPADGSVLSRRWACDAAGNAARTTRAQLTVRPWSLATTCSRSIWFRTRMLVCRKGSRTAHAGCDGGCWRRRSASRLSHFTIGRRSLCGECFVHFAAARRRLKCTSCRDPSSKRRSNAVAASCTRLTVAPQAIDGSVIPMWRKNAEVNHGSHVQKTNIR